MSKWGHLGIFMCLFLSTQAWASIGKVSLLKGDATASRNNQTIQLTTNASIEERDTIFTANNSQIQLTFEDKTVITLGSSSVLDIQEYLNDAQQPKAKFKFNQGTFKSITGEIGKKAPENFNLETKTATIGIRGTIISGQVGGNSNIGGNIVLLPDTIGCNSGQIVVSNAYGSVVISQGFQTTVSMGQPPAPPVVLSPSLINSMHGGALQPQPSPPPPSLPPIPNLAEQAMQTSQQTSTLNNINTQVETTLSTSFYPIFNPTLQSTSTNNGIVTLSGYTTSQYMQDGTKYISHTDALSLILDTTDDSIIDSSLTLDRPNPYQLLLTKSSDSSTMTYKSINKIAIKDFDTYQGWLQTENTYVNDYVSWGYWSIKANDDTKLLETRNYWVAGVDADAAHRYIAGKIGNADTPITNYTYNGNVLGSVTNGTNSYSIDPTNNNAVVFNFRFGGGSGSLLNTSYIKFQTVQTTPQIWQIGASGGLEGGSFNLGNEATVQVNGIADALSTSSIKGTFYGSNAEAVGGTFKATSGTSTASGVYKAVK